MKNIRNTPLESIDVNTFHDENQNFEGKGPSHCKSYIPSYVSEDVEEIENRSNIDFSNNLSGVTRSRKHACSECYRAHAKCIIQNDEDVCVRCQMKRKICTPRDIVPRRPRIRKPQDTFWSDINGHNWMKSKNKVNNHIMYVVIRKSKLRRLANQEYQSNAKQLCIEESKVKYYDSKIVTDSIHNKENQFEANIEEIPTNWDAASGYSKSQDHSLKEQNQISHFQHPIHEPLATLFNNASTDQNVPSNVILDKVVSEGYSKFYGNNWELLNFYLATQRMNSQNFPYSSYGTPLVHASFQSIFGTNQFQTLNQPNPFTKTNEHFEALNVIQSNSFENLRDSHGNSNTNFLGQMECQVQTAFPLNPRMIKENSQTPLGTLGRFQRANMHVPTNSCSNSISMYHQHIE